MGDAARGFIAGVGFASLICIVHQWAKAYVSGAGCQAAGSFVTWVAYLVVHQGVWHKSSRAAVGCART